MAIEFTMPMLGHLMKEGTVVRWLKMEGERIEKGEALVEIEMDKAASEVESFHSGIVVEILVNEKETVPVGTPLALIEEEGG